MSVSPVSLRRRSTAWNGSRWPWCSQSWRGAMAFTIRAAAPQPFSEACRTSPAASSSLAWRSSWPLGMSSMSWVSWIPTSPSIPALTGFAQAIIRCIAHTQGGSLYTRGNPLGLPFPSPRCGSIPAKAGGGRLRDHHLVAGVGSAWCAAQVKVPVNQLGSPRCRAPVAGRISPALLTRRWSSKEIWMRSGCSSGSIYWVVLVWERFCVAETVIPEAQERFTYPFSTPRHSPSRWNGAY